MCPLIYQTTGLPGHQAREKQKGTKTKTAATEQNRPPCLSISFASSATAQPSRCTSSMHRVTARSPSISSSTLSTSWSWGTRSWVALVKRDRNRRSATLLSGALRATTRIMLTGQGTGEKGRRAGHGRREEEVSLWGVVTGDECIFARGKYHHFVRNLTVGMVSHERKTGRKSLTTCLSDGWLLVTGQRRGCYPASDVIPHPRRRQGKPRQLQTHPGAKRPSFRKFFARTSDPSTAMDCGAVRT